MNLRKGISPVIATVIIVAVALAIAIAVVGWIMGIWGAVTGGTEMLKILPDSKLYNVSTGNFEGVNVTLHIKNEGGATATIFKVEIVGVGTNGTLSKTIAPGNDTYIIVLLEDKSVTPGATYTIKVYTKAGNVYSTQLVAESKTS